MPQWIVAAARQVMIHYGGDAAAIWSDQPSADLLQRRLDAFTGIGQKKVAMAVAILERDLGVPVRNLELTGERPRHTRVVLDPTARCCSSSPSASASRNAIR
jgi:hypothetical protein